MCYGLWIGATRYVSRIESTTTPRANQSTLHPFRGSIWRNCSTALRKIKMKVLRRPSTLGARRAMCQNCAADVYRALIQSTIVSTAKPTRQKSSRGVNCGYTDFTSSLLVRSAPTIQPRSDQPLIHGWFLERNARGRCTRGNIDSYCPLKIARACSYEESHGV